ncbi:hypothetical protein HY797_04390 [Candidatus Falkowbacteria bacterium]|nr:hypothetical protein [Candidatus Falkowbacteria bacterium]
MKKYFKKIVILISLAVVLVLPYVALAASPALDNLQEIGERGSAAPYTAAGEDTLSLLISQIIKAFLGLLGIIFLILIIYAGYNWMTAQGDEEKVTLAKNTLARAVIGLIIIIAAYSITYFVFSNLPGGGGGNGGAQTGPINSD